MAAATLSAVLQQHNHEDMAAKSAYIVGYTGEVGKQVVKIIQDYKMFQRLVLVGRRKVDDPAFQSSITEAQYKVDHDYVVNVAKVSQEMGCKHFHLVTSGHANPNSRMFYMRMKGEAERDSSALNFSQVSIYRPAFLLCDRAERRALERASLALVFNPLSKIAPTWLTIPTETVAKAMIMRCFYPPTDKKEVMVYENAPIHRLGAEFDAKFGSKK